MKKRTAPQVEELDLDLDAEPSDDAIIGQALRWSLAGFASVTVVVATLVWYFSRPAPLPAVQQTALAHVERRTAPAVEMPVVLFTDVTTQAGIDFRHENGAYGEKLLPETMGGGGAFFDYDRDGDPDLLLINSRRWPWDPRGDDGRPAMMALYQNDGQGQFTDVTAGSGLDVSLYGMGVAIGDFDADGLPDVFISALGRNRLFRNTGSGKFLDVTDAAGVGGDEDEWSTSCGWFDFDNDGHLDLFVCNYVKWSRAYDVAQNFQLTGGGRAYGRPQNFEGTFPYLYRNNGDGTFTEVGEAAGVRIRNPYTGVPAAKSLGLTFADFDDDGWIDIVVANDTVQNFLFHNQQDGTFREIGSPSGVAFDMDGNARGAMGIDVAAFRNDDALGIAIGNFANEMTALYVSGRRMQFVDEAVASGLGPNTRLELTFGVCFLDYDLDGRLDLVAANGHLEEDINRVQPSQYYEQPPQLFWNCGPEHETEFLPVPADKCGADLLRRMVGRAAAVADIDGDGDLDLLLVAVGQPPRLLRNDQQLGHHWLRFQLTGTGANRDAIGAWVEVETAGTVQRRQVMPTRGYLSQSELPVTFGLGEHDRVDRVTVFWPDGTVQPIPEVMVNRLHEITQADAEQARLTQNRANPPAVRPER